MKKQKQLLLFKPDPKTFGGQLLMGKRRGRRPLSSKDAIHLVMRSSWAMGPYSMVLLKNKKGIEALLEKFSRKFHIRIYRLAIVGNHCHLVIKVPNVVMYRRFVRSISGRIASLVMRSQSFKEFRKQWREYVAGEGSTRAEKERFKSAEGEPQGLEQAFWQHRPWTRILSWGRDFSTCARYVVQNQLEAIGFIAYQPRAKTRFTNWIATFQKSKE